MNVLVAKFKEKFNVRLTLIIPYLIGAGIFIILPTTLLLVKALTPVANSTFIEAAQNETVWNAIGRSVWMGLVAALIALIITLPFTWFVARNKSKTFRILAIMLIVSPLVVFTIARIFSLKILLLQIFDDGRTLPVKKWIMLLGMVYLYSPFMVIPLYSVLNNMPKSLLEASQDLGYNTFLTMIKVVIPYALKAIFAGAGMVFMLSATSLVISNTLVSATKNTHEILIGNILDINGPSMATSDLAAQTGSTIALITIAIMITVYGLIYLIPTIYRKIKGGVNV